MIRTRIRIQIRVWVRKVESRAVITSNLEQNPLQFQIPKSKVESNPNPSMSGIVEGVKDRFRANMDYYKKVYGREKPLPSWTDADVDEFVRSDPVYGPQMRLIKDGKKFIGIGGLLGAAHLAGVSWKYSKSPHGTVMAGLFGGFCGMTFGKEFATHWHQLYKYKSGEAQLRFLYWWEDKTAGSSGLDVAIAG